MNHLRQEKVLGLISRNLLPPWHTVVAWRLSSPGVCKTITVVTFDPFIADHPPLPLRAQRGAGGVFGRGGKLPIAEGVRARWGEELGRYRQAAEAGIEKVGRLCGCLALNGCWRHAV